MLMLVNPYMLTAPGGGGLAFFYASANGAGTDISDSGSMQSSGTFTVPAAWNGRYGRFSSGFRTSSGGTAITGTQSKGGSSFLGRGAVECPSVTGNPAGGTTFSAPVALSTGDTFTSSGKVSGVDNNYDCLEVFSSSFSGAMASLSSGTPAIGTTLAGVTMNNEVFDTHAYFSPSSATFTIPSGRSGLFRVWGQIEVSAATNDIGLGLTGTGLSGTCEVDTNGARLNIVSPPLALSAAATVGMTARAASAVNAVAGNQTWMAIEELPSTLKYAIARFSSNSPTLSTGGVTNNLSPQAEDADVGGWYTAGQDHFTVPSGVSRIRCGFFAKSSNSLGSTWCIFMQKNGSDLPLLPYSGQTNASVENVHAVSGIIEVSAGDTIEFRGRTSAGSMQAATGSFFWIEEVPTVT